MKIANMAKWDLITNVKALSKIENPVMGKRHVPINHGEALKIFRDKIADYGFKPSAEKGMLSPDTKRYVYVADIADKTLPTDYTFTLGFVNFNDKRKAFTGISGERVFVCSNGMIQGLNDITRRHSTNVLEYLEGKIDNIVERFKEFKEGRVAEINVMKAREFGNKEVGMSILHLMRNAYMSNTDVTRIVEEWDKPSYDDFKPRTAWSFQNAATHIFKKYEDPTKTVHTCEILRNAIKEAIAA